MNIKIIITFLSLLLFQNITSAQYQEKVIDHITSKQGLSHGWIHCIFQDSYGFIWIGTEDGLNKYDGVGFTVYKHIPGNKNSIPSSCVYSIEEDSNTNLWFATRNSLVQYKRKSGNFISYKKYFDGRVRSIAKNNQGLWIAAEEKLMHKTNSDSILIFQDNKKLNKEDATIITIYTDSNEKIWLGTRKGLKLYNKKTNSFTTYLSNSNASFSISDDNITSITEDSNGRLWIGTRSGELNLLSDPSQYPHEAKFLHFKNDIDNINSINSGSILALIEDKNHTLWIGHENGGLDKLEIQSKEFIKPHFIHYKHNSDSNVGLNSNSIHAIYEDTQGTIWLGTFGKGVNKMRENLKPFTHFKQQSNNNNNNTINNNLVNAFLEDGDYLWIGTEGGLNRYNKQDGSFKYYVHNPNDKSSIGSNAVWALNKDSKGNLWVGTWAGGLNLYDYDKDSFKHFFYNPDDSLSIGSDNIFAITETKSGELWLGTMGGGLNMYNSENETFTRYNETNSNIGDIYIEVVKETKRGELWISNVNNAGRFDRKTKNFEYFHYNENDTTSISGQRIIDIYEDRNENLWICTEAGLNLFNRNTSSFKSYQSKDGLPDNTIKSICSDNDGNLWLGTNKGLSVFYDAVNLPQKPIFKNYYEEDGIQGNEFNRRSCIRTKNGEIYFGGTNGFNSFYPENLKDNRFIPPVMKTDFLIFNKTLEVGNPESPLKKHINVTDTIILSYKHSVFTFKFAALNYIVSKKNKYAVMLEGFEDNWRYIGTQKMATYTNIDPGEYVFRIKASNNDDLWNEEGTSVLLIILPPYWQTWWFRTMLIILIFGSIISFFLVRLKIMKKQKEVLEQKVAKRTHQLIKANTVLNEKQEEIIQQTEELQITNNKLLGKNETIRGSISYAKTIQHAVLPSIDTLNNLFDNFIIFKPKDVVSGDFYWFTSVNDQHFIAIVDCTGHGVPGAFMSIIGTTLLNEIVNINKIYEPNNILETLNVRVKKSLNQETSNNDDGMDVCLCKIEAIANNFKITYCGAKRPLFIFKQINNELLSIKGSVKSIGGKFYQKQSFSNTEITLNKGDMLYLSSDGYVDQCNSERMSFGTKRLKMLLEKLAPKSMNEQQNELEKALEKHQQNEQQRDDIALLGIRL